MKIRILTINLVIAFIYMLLPTTTIASNSDIVISELSMGSSASATEEFVELYNNSENVINIANWSIYYRSSTGTTYSKKVTFPTTANIQPHSFLLVSTSSPNDLVLISGMSQTGGVVELRDDKSNIVDRVGYGNTNLSNGKPAIAPQSGESIYRQYDEPNKAMINTSDNLSDFYITSSMSPGAIPVVEIEEFSDSISYPSIFINEIYPNPNPEQSESADEFIELYNPNNILVDLNGWLIKDSSGKTFIIKNKSIDPMGYLSFYSSETGISLNNTGDIVDLYTPNSDLKDQTQDYGDAKEGLSWGLVNGAWAWNNTSTPGTTNSDSYVEIIVPKAVATKSTVAKKQAVKKAAVAKKAAAKKPKATKLKSNKAQASSSSGDTGTTPDIQSKFANIWPWLMIVLGTATIGYGIYEYRPEITNTYLRFKEKFRSSK
jgi:hypothetical protein